MPNTHDVGDLVKVSGSFTNSAGTAIDPTAVVLITTDPNDNDVGYQYNLNSQGAWDASGNSPTLADGTGTAGHYYTVGTAGTVDFGNGNIVFGTADYAYYNGHVWQKLPNVSSTAVTKNGTGDYSVDVYAVTAGTWLYRYEGVGTGQSSDENHFHVRSRRVS